MMETGSSSTEIQRRLDRLRAGDASALDELLRIACERLVRLSRKMLRGYPALHSWEQTDDVFQNAAVRICRALETVKPESVRSFMNLAAVQIRRELIDLARHYHGPEGPGHHVVAFDGPAGSGGASGAGTRAVEAADHSSDPARLAAWTEFHDRVGELPDPEREVFDLLWYQGLSQAEAAALLGVTDRVVKYRWRLARLGLHKLLGGRLPV